MSENYLAKIRNFIVEYSRITVGLFALTIFYFYEITFSTLMFYLFSLIGAVVTVGLLIFGIVILVSKGTLDENEKLKANVQTLQAKVHELNIERYKQISAEHTLAEHLAAYDSQRTQPSKLSVQALEMARQIESRKDNNPSDTHADTNTDTD